MCDQIAQDMQLNPGLYKGKKIIILMTDGDDDLISDAKKMRTQFKRKYPDIFGESKGKEKSQKPFVIQIMDAFDHLKLKPEIEQMGPVDIFSASGFLNQQVLTQEESEGILEWIGSKVSQETGVLIFTGQTPFHFSRIDLETRGWSVLQTTQKGLCLVTTEGQPYERAPFYVITKK